MEKELEQHPSAIIKIVILGPQTIKEPLIKQLAIHYNTKYVAQYAKKDLATALDTLHIHNKETIIPIAKGQIALENRLSLQAKRVLLCQSNLLDIKVHTALSFTSCKTPILDYYALEHYYDIYLLNQDIPWKNNVKQDMFLHFKETLEKYNKNYFLLKGDLNTRLKMAIEQIDKLLEDNTFTEQELLQFSKKGISRDTIAKQLQLFKKGNSFVTLDRAATIEDGIIRLEKQEKEFYKRKFQQEKNQKTLLKFVPASGAATRMFKEHFAFLHHFNPEKESFTAYVKRTKAKIIPLFFEKLKDLPFYHTLMQCIAIEHPEFNTLPTAVQKKLLVEKTLDKAFLGYGNYPKGLLPFHRYNTHSCTAFYEHLIEADLYNSANGVSNNHFTISKEHYPKFLEKATLIKNKIQNVSDTVFHISFSFQKETTDTVAVDLDNKMIKNATGEILFRPAGHGALIENLNDLDADIIFIKNIDNVVVENYKQEVCTYKEILAGKLLEIQEKTFYFLNIFDKKQSTEAVIFEACLFLKQTFKMVIAENFYTEKTKEQQEQYLIEKLNKPIRVCGMVRNQGEPGGGPFWVKDPLSDQISLQIIESAQINTQNKEQASILQSATHFNPVDLVCGVRNFKGDKFNLLDFIDHKQYFITQKSRDGRELKALEKPGLWNGAMAHWNTIFIEVPLITFNPVKTVTDLLKPAHQVV